MSIKCKVTVSVSNPMSYEEEVELLTHEAQAVQDGSVPKRIIDGAAEKVGLKVSVEPVDGLKMFQFYRDEKCTIWERVFFRVFAKSKAEALQKMIDGDVDCDESEMLYDTQETLLPSENGGCPTVEIFDAEENLPPLWGNGLDESH